MEENVLITLMNLASEKKEYLDEMLILSQSQLQAIKEEEFEMLADILDKKDSLIDNINKVDLKYKEYKGESSIEDKPLLEILSQMNEVLSKIKIIDDDNNKKLQSSINDMKINLKDVRQGKRAMNKYGDADPYKAFASQGGTLFIDQDS